MSNLGCAGCMVLGSDCSEYCEFAAYYPQGQEGLFENVHRVFSGHTVRIILREIEPQERPFAVYIINRETQHHIQEPNYRSLDRIQMLQMLLDQFSCAIYNFDPLCLHDPHYQGQLRQMHKVLQELKLIQVLHRLHEQVIFAENKIGFIQEQRPQAIQGQQQPQPQILPQQPEMDKQLPAIQEQELPLTIKEHQQQVYDQPLQEQQALHMNDVSNLSRGYEEALQMSSILNLRMDRLHRAQQLYCRLDDRYLKRKVRRTIFAGCLYIACSDLEARTPNEMSKALKIKWSVLGLAATQIRNELNIEKTNINHGLITRFHEDLQIPMNSVDQCFQCFEKVLNTFPGRKPTTLISSIIYIMCRGSDHERSLSEISVVTKVSEKSIKEAAEQIKHEAETILSELQALGSPTGTSTTESGSGNLMRQ